MRTSRLLPLTCRPHWLAGATARSITLVADANAVSGPGTDPPNHRTARTARTPTLLMRAVISMPVRAQKRAIVAS